MMGILGRLWNGMGQRIFFTFSLPLGSGYTGPMKNIAVLMDAICEAYDNGDWKPKDGVTFCNYSVQYVANKFGYARFAGKLANEMIDILNNDKRWCKLSANEAAQCAAAGVLVIAARKDTPHGHVCIVRPGTTEFSGHWQENAPKVMNMGKNCFIDKGANFAFQDKPDYFALEG